MSFCTKPSQHAFNPAFGRVVLGVLCLALVAGILVLPHGAHAAFPTTGLLDNFNRAAEDPLGNGTWTCPLKVGDANLKIGSLQHVESANSSADCYWSASKFGANSEAYVTIIVLPEAGNCDALLVRVSSPNTSSLSGYWGEYCAVAGASNDTFTISRLDNGIFTSV